MNEKRKLNRDCNMQLAGSKVNQLKDQKRVAVLRTRRDVESLEQLLWDYKDQQAQILFTSYGSQRN